MLSTGDTEMKKMIETPALELFRLHGQTSEYNRR